MPATELHGVFSLVLFVEFAIGLEFGGNPRIAPPHVLARARVNQLVAVDIDGGQ
jgi:hypothetical protein